MIHDSYGGDLDMTTDEEDTYRKPSLDLNIDLNSPTIQRIQSNDKYDVSSIDFSFSFKNKFDIEFY